MVRIRDLIDEARGQDLDGGDCFEVHISQDGELCCTQVRLLDEFINDWSELPGWDVILHNVRLCQHLDLAWLGVVHDDGVMVAPLDVETFNMSECPF